MVEKVIFVPNLVPLIQCVLPMLVDFSFFEFYRATHFVVFLPILVDFDSGSFQMVPILVDFFLPILILFKWYQCVRYVCP